MMTLTMMILLFVLAAIVEQSLDYNEETDQKPDSLWHKIIRRLHAWICKGEDVTHA